MYSVYKKDKGYNHNTNSINCWYKILLFSRNQHIEHHILIIWTEHLHFWHKIAQFFPTRAKKRYSTITKTSSFNLCQNRTNYLKDINQKQVSPDKWKQPHHLTYPWLLPLLVIFLIFESSTHKLKARDCLTSFSLISRHCSIWLH